MDQKTYIEAFKEHNKSIYNFIFLRVNLQKVVAEDLSQECFLKAWNYRHTYNSKKSGVKTWLFKIAKNVIYDNYKKEKFKFDDLEKHIDMVFEEEFGEKKILIEVIYRSFDMLSELEKEVLILRFIEELELKEICEIVGKSYVNTKVLIHRSINKLKKKIG